MDREIMEWVNQQPEDWWAVSQSAVYTWGKGSWNQLGHSIDEEVGPGLAEDWKDIQQVS